MSARQTALVGKRLGVQRLNLHGTGLGDRGLPVTPADVVTGAMWLKARDTLCRIDTANEVEYFMNGGILHYVLRKLAA